MIPIASSHLTQADGLYPDAVALRAAMARNEVSAQGALEACFAVIEDRNGDLNAVVYQDRDGARAAAARCDRARSAIGPLHGVPITIKESFDWAGHPTTWGDPARAGRMADKDSDVVALLKQAGAVIIGKTNIPAYLSDWETTNPLFGPTRNPVDPGCSAGGSSGGSAAAVATGMSYMDIGSDQGGSIRYPAHNCGIHGLKPSWGLVPLGGHSPLGERRTPDIGVAGPLTRSARDADLALDALLGAAGQHRAKPLAECRFALLPQLPGCPIDAGYQQSINAFCTRLKQTGAHVEVAKPEFDFDRATDLMNLLVRAETVRKSALAADLRNRIGLQARQNSAQADGEGLSHRDWLSLHEERLALREVADRFFDRFDFLLCPAAAGPAAPLRPDGNAANRTVPVDGREEPILKQHMLHMPGSLLYLPAHVMPIDRYSTGLPLGIQLVGPYGQDRQVLAAADGIERAGLMNLDGIEQ